VEGDPIAWEQEPLTRLAADGQLSAYRHEGFWQPVGHTARFTRAAGALGRRPAALETMALDPAFWRGKRVFVTGHTGFKGGWLTLLLRELGAEVHGLRAGAGSRTVTLRRHPSRRRHPLEDLRHPRRRTFTRLGRAGQAGRRVSPRGSGVGPQVLHRTAGTIAVNVLGTANLLEAIRRAEHLPAAVVVITTDKCYENREWPWAYRETDALGGRDIYSASKAAAECSRRPTRGSFLQKLKIPVATARAGNVIGGGDWATDRLLPDLVRAVRHADLRRSAIPRRSGPGSMCSNAPTAICCSPRRWAARAKPSRALEFRSRLRERQARRVGRRLLLPPVARTPGMAA